MNLSFDSRCLHTLSIPSISTSTYTWIVLLHNLSIEISLLRCTASLSPSRPTRSGPSRPFLSLPPQILLHRPKVRQVRLGILEHVFRHVIYRRILSVEQHSVSDYQPSLYVAPTKTYAKMRCMSLSKSSTLAICPSRIRWRIVLRSIGCLTIS